MISFVRPSLDFGQFRPNSNAILQFLTLTSNFTPFRPISDAIVKTACNLGNVPFFCWCCFFFFRATRMILLATVLWFTCKGLPYGDWKKSWVGTFQWFTLPTVLPQTLRRQQWELSCELVLGRQPYITSGCLNVSHFIEITSMFYFIRKNSTPLPPPPS